MTTQQDLLIQEAAAIARHVAVETDMQKVWKQADAAFDRIIGHRMFTVLRYEAETGKVWRLYTSNPADYPVGGFKVMGPTPWGDLVLKQGQPFVGKDADAVRWAYPDHETIIGLGFESALNIPMCVAGKTLGTINLTHVAGHYQERHVRDASVLAACLTPLCMHSNSSANY
ncbi:MAG: GAF domain-containing protein [Sneathiella sp.]|nr:MAG: GAF domain-containing protein [Sneathiella sp.]